MENLTNKIKLAAQAITDLRISETKRVGYYDTDEYEREFEAIQSQFDDVKIYSPTGVCRGSGCDRYRSVISLTKIERTASRVGCSVYVDSNTDYRGITTKFVEYQRGYFNHRQLEHNVDTSAMLQIN